MTQAAVANNERRHGHDVIQCTAARSDDIGCRGRLLHAEPEDAADFDRHLIPEYETSPSNELDLVPSLKDIKPTLQAKHR